MQAAGLKACRHVADLSSITSDYDVYAAVYVAACKAAGSCHLQSSGVSTEWVQQTLCWIAGQLHVVLACLL